MENKIRVVFIYKRTTAYLSRNHFSTTYYHFFMSALRRNERINVTYFPTGNSFDTTALKDKFDIILLYENFNSNMPDELIGIQKLNIPVICSLVDAQHDIPRELFHEKYKIDYYFSIVPESFFYKYYPRSYKYKVILFGVEPSLYTNIIPYNQRIKNRILNSGNVATTKLASRMLKSLLHPASDPYRHYKLRTSCNKLPYVDYTTTLGHEYVGDKYPLLLSKYAAAIAATTSTPTIKYLEIPAAGCLTFMEITEKNNGWYLGFKDGETAVFINERNYKDKFNEYLSDLENPKWEKIANDGRKYVLNELNNDKAVESLVDLMEKLL